MTFGRKGLDGQAAAGNGSPGFGMRGGGTLPPTSPGIANALKRGESGDAGMSPELRAFLANERANRPVDFEPDISPVAEQIRPVATRSGGSPREMWVAYLLWWFFGGFGAHRFYLGQMTSAVAMICTLLGSFAMMFILPPLGLACFLFWCLWLLADAVMIPGMTRKYNDSLMVPAAVFA